MIKELKSLRDLGSFNMVDRPQGVNILEYTWAFKKKRYPNGGLKQFKAQFCVKEDQKVDRLDFFETYDPVVAWVTVMILLILSMILHLKTQHVD